MSKVEVKDGESLDNALRRFKIECSKNGLMAEIKKRKHYEKPSIKKKRKAEAARKKKRKF